MKWTWPLATGITTVMIAASCSKDDDTPAINNNPNSQDTTFMMQASISNSAEIGAATLALSRSTTPQVIAFANFMVMEHTMAQANLKALGDTVGIAVRDTIDPAHLAIAAQLAALTGRMFDSMYIHTQVTDHQTAVTLFTAETNNGRNSSVKGYANRYLPHIQAHYTRADSIATHMF